MFFLSGFPRERPFGDGSRRCRSFPEIVVAAGDHHNDMEMLKRSRYRRRPGGDAADEECCTRM